MNKKRIVNTFAIAVGVLLTLWPDEGHAGENATDARTQDGPVQVAVFQDEGVGPSAEDLIEALLNNQKERFEVQRISGEQIREGGLDGFDVLIHPGGSGSKQGRALGEKGRKRVTDFVRQGGGFLGVCGGCYLATNDYTWSLGLIDARCLDRMHWARGTGTVTLQLSPAATRFFGNTGDEVEIHYGQGPLLVRPEWGDDAVPDYESLAIYGSEIAKKGAPKGIMKGTSAIVRAHFGAGRVVCFSPHPELTDGLGHWVPRVVNWLTPSNEEQTIDSKPITEALR
jgi:glutamine amidotransferase-like uncharacterized protein